jgi:hypothetical protein
MSTPQASPTNNFIGNDLGERSKPDFEQEKEGALSPPPEAQDNPSSPTTQTPENANQPPPERIDEQEKIKEKERFYHILETVSQLMKKVGIEPTKHLALTACLVKEVMSHPDQFQGKNEQQATKEMVQFLVVALWREIIRSIGAEKIIDSLSSREVFNTIKSDLWGKTYPLEDEEKVKTLGREQASSLLLTDLVANTASLGREKIIRGSPGWQKMADAFDQQNISRAKMARIGDKILFLSSVRVKLDTLDKTGVLPEVSQNEAAKTTPETTEAKQNEQTENNQNNPAVDSLLAKQITYEVIMSNDFSQLDALDGVQEASGSIEQTDTSTETSPAEVPAAP